MVATAEKPRGRTKTTEPEPKLVLPVQFGDVTIGDGVAGIKVTISRDKLALEIADEYLCCKRLIGSAVIVPGVDDLDQTYMNNTGKVKHRVRGAFDVNSFSVTPKKIGARISFSIESIDIEVLSHFAKQNGFLVVELLQAIPEKRKADANGQKEFDDDIKVLGLTEGSENILRAHNIDTVDALTTLITAGELKGVAKTKTCIAEIEDAHFKYRQNKPGDNGSDEDDGEDE